jgi:hypothetical protein
VNRRAAQGSGGALGQDKPQSELLAGSSGGSRSSDEECRGRFPASGKLFFLICQRRMSNYSGDA